MTLQEAKKIQKELQIYNPFAMMMVQQQIKANKAIAVLRRDRDLKKAAELGSACFKEFI